MEGFLDRFETGEYQIETYGNSSFGAEDWIYRFICKKNDNTERRFELRTRIIQTRQFYLSERIDKKWDAIIHFPGRPSYDSVKSQLINYLSRGN